MVGNIDEHTVFRCQPCGWVVTQEDIRTGGCAMCGGRRVQVATRITDEEVAWLGERGYKFDDERWSHEPFENRKS